MSAMVTTQEELDAAMARREIEVYINAPAGVWLTLRSSGSSRVVAWDSSHVEARGSSRVVARGSSRVVARGSSHVVAWDSSRIVAWDSSHVVASDSSRVVAWDSSHVEARGSSRVEASKYVSVHLWSQKVTLTGGAVLDMTTLDMDDPSGWCDYHGVTVADGKALLYKAVHDDWCTDRGAQWTYKPGETVTAADYERTHMCGQGLHLCPSPHGSASHLADATRFVACGTDLTDLIPLGDKCKTRSVRVLYEVDEWGDRIAEADQS